MNKNNNNNNINNNNNDDSNNNNNNDADKKYIEITYIISASMNKKCYICHLHTVSVFLCLLSQQHVCYSSFIFPAGCN